MRVELEFIGENIVARDILGVGERAQDLRPAWEDALDTLRRAASRQFDSEGGYGSGGWAPLAPSTVRFKAAHGLDPRIMHRTYRLRDSLSATGGSGSVARVTRQQLEYGTTVPYAGYHQSGTSRMPQRRLVQVPESDRRDIVRSVYQRIMSEHGRFDG